MPNAAYFREQAQKCRRLARGADYQTATALKEMEAEYNAKAALPEAEAQRNAPGQVGRAPFWFPPKRT
jgi:hypothetical protein